MRLIVHAGTHKTGSTSIQRALRENRKWLAERGFYYPFGISPFRKVKVPHHRLAYHLTGVEEGSRQKAERFARKAIESAGDAHTMIISSEKLYRYVAGQATWDNYCDIENYWDRRRDYLAGFKQLFADFDIDVIIFFRRKDTFATSFINMLRVGGWEGDEARFAAQFPQLLDYDAQQRVFEDSVGPVTTLNYEDAMTVGGSVVQFFRTIGCEVPPSVDGIWDRRHADRSATATIDPPAEAIEGADER